MNQPLHGIHHITAVSSAAQDNLDFYAGVLGLRLVKWTVNFDDPTMYHLYFADKTGSPGSLLTFFPITDSRKGRVGPGQVATVGFSIPPASVGFWAERLARHDVAFDGPFARFDEEVISLRDNDGLPLELVTDSQHSDNVWSGSGVPLESAIRRFHSASLSVARPESTSGLLKLMGFEKIAAETSRERYRAFDGATSQFIDLIDTGEVDRGVPGAGTVHHIAWRCHDNEQEDWRSKIAASGYSPTAIIDRKYFRSVYFREHSGILFEVASDGPGMLVDENEKELGTHLMLPPWHENKRATIEQRLPVLRFATRTVSL